MCILFWRIIKCPLKRKLHLSPLNLWLNCSKLVNLLPPIIDQICAELSRGGNFKIQLLNKTQELNKKLNENR